MRVTGWSSDPWTRGSYSYIAVGSSPSDILALARPVGDGRVRFAGEATHPRFYGTMHGAYDSGVREADLIGESYDNREADRCS